jgi:hypothetical protein
MSYNVQTKVRQLREARGLLCQIAPQAACVLGDDDIKVSAASRCQQFLIAGARRRSTANGLVTELSYDIKAMAFGQSRCNPELIIY